MEVWAAADLVIVVSQHIRRTAQQRFQPGFAVDQGKPAEILAVQEQQIKQEEDQRSPARIGRVLDQVECRPAIRQHPAKFAVKVGILRRQSGIGLGDGRVFIRPVVTSAGQELHVAGVEPGVHAVSVEFDFVHPVGAVRCLFDERRKLRLDPCWWRSRVNLSSGPGRRRGHQIPKRYPSGGLP